MFRLVFSSRLWISNPTGLQDKECYLQDILIRASHGTDSRFVVAIKDQNSIFHVARVTDILVLEIEDAVSILNLFVRLESGIYISTFCKPMDDLSSLPDQKSIHRYLITIFHA